MGYIALFYIILFFFYFLDVYAERIASLLVISRKQDIKTDGQKVKDNDEKEKKYKNYTTETMLATIMSTVKRLGINSLERVLPYSIQM